MAKRKIEKLRRSRNSILGIASPKKDYLHKNHAAFDAFEPFHLHELSTAVGLAFTAVMAEGIDVKFCRSALDIFLKYRQAINDPENLSAVTIAITTLLESGLSAFKNLGYPYYFDDFIWACKSTLNASNHVPMSIKEEISRILSRFLKFS
jgi:hypothetical protein